MVVGNEKDRTIRVYNDEVGLIRGRIEEVDLTSNIGP
jgi:hypothetical protein